LLNANPNRDKLEALISAMEEAATVGG